MADRLFERPKFILGRSKPLPERRAVSYSLLLINRVVTILPFVGRLAEHAIRIPAKGTM